MKYLALFALVVCTFASIAMCDRDPPLPKQHHFLWRSVNKHQVTVQPTVRPLFDYDENTFLSYIGLYAKPHGRHPVEIAYQSQRIVVRGRVQFKLTFDASFLDLSDDSFCYVLTFNGGEVSRSSYIGRRVVLPYSNEFAVEMLRHNGQTNKVIVDVYQTDQRRHLLTAIDFANGFIYSVQTVSSDGKVLNDYRIFPDQFQNWRSTDGPNVRGVEIIFSMPADFPHYPFCITIRQQTGAALRWRSGSLTLPHYRAVQPRNYAPAVLNAPLPAPVALHQNDFCWKTGTHAGNGVHTTYLDIHDKIRNAYDVRRFNKYYSLFVHYDDRQAPSPLTPIYDEAKIAVDDIFVFRNNNARQSLTVSQLPERRCEASVEMYTFVLQYQVARDNIPFRLSIRETNNSPDKIQSLSPLITPTRHSTSTSGSDVPPGGSRQWHQENSHLSRYN